MVNFKIVFLYKNVAHTADVHRVPFVNNLPVQYHVRNILPEIIGMPDTFMLIHGGGEKGFTWSIIGDPEVPKLIYTAIFNYCNLNHIPLIN